MHGGSLKHSVHLLRQKYSLCYVGLLAMKKRKPWHCASAGQQHPEHSCVISTGVATNPKGSTIGAAGKKVNSIPARPSSGGFRPSTSLLGGEVNCITQSWSPGMQDRVSIPVCLAQPCLCFLHKGVFPPACVLFWFIKIFGFASYLERQFFWLIHKRGKKKLKLLVMTKNKDCLGRKV